MAKLNKERIFKAADGYIRSGKFQKAIAEYEKWVAANPKDTNTLRNIGDLYARLGRNAQAIKKYTQVAEFYRNDGFNVRAIATYKMILRLDPQSENAMAALAELQVTQGLLMEAKSQYQTLVELYTKSGQKKRAAGVFKKLAEIDPSDLKVRYKFAEFLDRQGQAEQAIAEYVGIADEFINNGLVPEAIQIMEKGLHIDSANRALRCKLAQASILQGDYPKAIQLLDQVRGRYPDDVELLSRLGEAYMGAGNLDEAETVFSRLTEIDPDNPEHASRRAELAAHQGDYDKALEQLNPVVARYLESGDGDKAAAMLQKVLSKDPHHVKTLVKLAEIYTVLKKEQARLSAYDQLCEAYAHHGNYEKAVHVAEQLIELEPENAQYKDRLRFLKSRLQPGVEEEPEPAEAVEVVVPGLQEAIEVGQELVEELHEHEAPVQEETPVGPPPVDEYEEIPTLSSEDEEHIKEKMTEAEVFVRYGLVDKAVDQLNDVLESFRYHTTAREKLIEIYKDQGMNREAADQVMELARVYTRLGEEESAEELFEEARELNPAMAESAEAVPATEEEIELTLTPDDDLESAGLETDFIAPTGGDLVDEEVPVAVEEQTAVPEDRTDSLVDEPPAISREEEMVLSLEESGDFAIEVELESEELAPGPEAAGSRYEEELEPEEELPAFEVQDGVGIDEEVQVEDEMPVEVEEEAVPVVMEDEQLAEVDEEILVEEEPQEVFEDVSPSVGVGDEVEIELEMPAAEPPAEEEVEPFTLEGGDEEISVEIPEVASEAPRPELEIPEIPIEAIPSPTGPAAPEPVAELATSPVESGVSAELQEVDEYIALGLYEDARDSLRELLRRNRGDSQVLAKIEELGFSVPQLQKEAEGVVAEEVVVEPPSFHPPVETPTPVATGQEEPLASIEGLGEPEALDRALSPTTETAPEPFADLASPLSEEMFATQSAVQEEEAVQEPAEAISDPGLDEIFREFKKGVEKQLGTEDYDTRYNLGIAYKEMGLLDEAIAEFQLASKDEARLLECCSMLGLCFMEKGMPEIAIKWFEKGLAAPGRNEEEYHGLRYDLAQAHEAAGEPEQALALYMDIYRVNARFRDVKDRVRELQAAKK